jgi:hypothetical protein
MLCLLTLWVTFGHFVLFKILILIYKNIIYILNYFSDKSNHNTIYNDALTFF